MEQKALIARVQAGDRSAFADLTSRYRDMAFGYALALLRDFHLAQDVTQEAFLTAYLNLGKLQDPAAFPRWLQGIVRNHCHRVLRTRHLDLVPLDEGIGVPAMARGPEQHLEEREALHRVLAQIMTLPRAQREVATLFYVKDYSPREIAAFLDLPATTVYNRLHTARKKLKGGLLTMPRKSGRIVHVCGPVVDADFAPEGAPAVLRTLTVRDEVHGRECALAVAQHLGPGVVRGIAVAPAEWLAPGMEVLDSGSPISAPVRADVLGAALPILLAPRGAMLTRPTTSCYTGIQRCPQRWWSNQEWRFRMTHTNKTRAQLIVELEALDHERQRVQYALRERDHLYRLLVENSLGLMCVHDLDGVLLAINSAAAQSLGYRPEEGIGRSLREFLAPSVRHLFDAYLTRIRRNPADSGLLRLVAKDGSERVWEYRNVRYDEPGSLPRVLGHALDITERTAAEHALKESEERFRLIADNARDMICLMDLEWRCVYASPSCTAILGYPLQTLQGMRMLDLMHPDDFTHVPDWRNTSPALFEFRVRRVDGRWMWLEGSSATVIWNRAPHVVGIARDITERKWADEERTRLYRELAERERRLQDLVGRLLVAQEEERRRVAYEVHDDLAAVAASAHQHLQAFARHHRPRTPEAREEFDRALELVQRTVREARRVVANLRPTTLDDFGLAAALRLQVEELQAEGWHVSYEEALGPERLPPLVETALYRVAQEALTNVRKHAHTTEVRVTLEPDGAEARLVVEDAGCGFTPGAIMPGTGAGERVGLAGMRERVAMLGGHCVVESKPGAGTRVSVVVPLEPPAADHSVN